MESSKSSPLGRPVSLFPRASFKTLLPALAVPLVLGSCSSTYLRWQGSVSYPGGGTSGTCAARVFQLNDIHESRSRVMVYQSPSDAFYRKMKRKNEGTEVGAFTLYDSHLYDAILRAVESCPDGIAINKRAVQKTKTLSGVPISPLVATPELYHFVSATENITELTTDHGTFPPRPREVLHASDKASRIKAEMSASRQECTRIGLMLHTHTSTGPELGFDGEEVDSPYQWLFYLEVDSSGQRIPPDEVREAPWDVMLGQGFQMPTGYGTTSTHIVFQYQWQMHVYRPFILCFPPGIIGDSTSNVTVYAGRRPDGAQPKSVFSQNNTTPEVTWYIGSWTP